MRHFRILNSMLCECPILVIFDVTRLCNQRCRMCNIWRTKSDDMGLTQVAGKAKELRAAGVGYIFLQGGEPTLRADLVDVVDLFLKEGIKPTVISNGILMNGELANQLATRRCNVAISLDTLNRETFHYIRGVDKFEVVTENIRRIADIHNRQGNWSVTTTVTEMASMEEIQALESFAHECGLMYAIRPYIHVTGAAGRQDDKLAYQDTARIIKVFEYMRDKARTDNYLASLIYDEHIHYIKGEPQPVCDALRRSMVMSPTGIFSPCIEFTEESEPLADMLGKRKNWLARCEDCNKKTPCFYNDAREIGILWRKKWQVLAAFPLVIKQLIRYGNFF